ncbi:hypothetical protein BKA80DRAFT_55428 [Phyllosticta citrichinensis]
MTGQFAKRPRQPGLAHSSALVMVVVPAEPADESRQAKLNNLHSTLTMRVAFFPFPCSFTALSSGSHGCLLDCKSGCSCRAGWDGMGWAGLSTHAGLARRVSDLVRRTVAWTVDVVDVGGLGFFEFQQGRRTTCLRGMDADDDDDWGSQMRGGLATAGWLTSLLRGLFLWKCQKASPS